MEEKMMDGNINAVKPVGPGSVRLLPGEIKRRYELNRKYMMSLDSAKLLQNFYMEAGVNVNIYYSPDLDDCHKGWEHPACQLRGHFLGHWLSAASLMSALNDDAEIKIKADHIISELGKCQKENGGEWAGSIPEKYFDWIARGKQVWAPHYTIHKTLMGLWDMYRNAGNTQAFDILCNFAKWFTKWSSGYSRAQMDDILDFETGGMLEVWANLYGETGKQEHLDLLYKYDRPRLFDRLIKGEDVLTNMHANTTIPEIQGAARAWEVTGDERWRRIVEAYWKLAVTDRGYYCTGGQTHGEIWTPPFDFFARLGEKNQEHCTVYNMMRLSDFMFRWTGDPAFGDYWERNMLNGILAQQNKNTGMIAYFLPLAPGSTKKWGTATKDFWCCHGTLVQAHPYIQTGIYYEDDAGLYVQQYIPSELNWGHGSTGVKVRMEYDNQTEKTHKPDVVRIRIKVTCETPSHFRLNVRIPWWVAGDPVILVNGKKTGSAAKPSCYAVIDQTWSNDEVFLEFPKKLTCCPIPGKEDYVAFMDGPVVLAGLTDEDAALTLDRSKPETGLAVFREREWGNWITEYRTFGRNPKIRFIPLNEVADEKYTVYFPVTDQK